MDKRWNTVKLRLNTSAEFVVISTSCVGGILYEKQGVYERVFSFANMSVRKVGEKISMCEVMRELILEYFAYYNLKIVFKL